MAAKKKAVKKSVTTTAKKKVAKKVSAKTKPAAQAAPAQDKAAKVQGNGHYEPKILVFACNWCSYAGADTAGVSRIQYSPKFRVIRTMCSGRISTSHVLKAFKLGADGVLISGCHIGDCHYIFGNERAIDMFERTKKTLRVLGLEDKRIRLEWVSAAEGIRWAELIDEFVTQIEELGPSPMNREKAQKA